MAEASKHRKIDEEMSTAPDLINRLPDEILIDEIFRRLDIKTRPKARQTCRRWRSAVPIADGQGRLFVAQLPFKLDPNPNEFKADQVTLALRSILPEEGENLKLLSFACKEIRRCVVGKESLEIIVSSCPNLVSLDLTWVHWTEDVLRFDWSSLSRMARLSEFHMGFFWRPNEPDMQKFRADLTQLISTWPLTKLSLDSFYQRERCPGIHATRLTDLSLIHYHISDAQLPEICQNSPNIFTLNLRGVKYHNGRDVDDFSPVATLSDLQQLEISCGKISNDHFRLICAGCPQLTRLDLFGCDNLTDYDCLESLQHLKSLAVGPKFNDAQVSRMPEKWSLEEFESSGVRNCDLTDLGLTTLSRKCPGLKVISIKRCGNITDASVPELVDNCRLLEEVRMFDTGVTSDYLMFFGRCEFLRTLKLSNGTHDSILRLQQSRQDNNVTTPLHLHFVYCGQLSAEHLNSLQSANIHVQQMHAGEW